MDPITHGLIGASASSSFAERQKLGAAAVAGAGGAMLPDLDVLIDSASDPLLQLEFHRTITHSFVFMPLGALLAAALLWWFLKSRLTFGKIYLHSLAGIATAGLADTFTSYGVQLLWPFGDTRFSWNLISVFDPVFSLGLVVALGWALIKKKQLAVYFGLAWMALYLIFASIQQQRAHKVAQKLSAQRGHHIEKLIIKPTIANELLWSIRYTYNDTLYADGVNLLPLTDPQIYRGTLVSLLNWRDKYAEFRGTTLYRDIARFDKLSDGILIAHPDTARVIGDGRYSMLPTTVDPLWGIKIDTENINQHVKFNTYRDANPNIRATFLGMLLGKNLTH